MPIFYYGKGFRKSWLFFFFFVMGTSMRKLISTSNVFVTFLFTVTQSQRCWMLCVWLLYKTNGF